MGKNPAMNHKHSISQYIPETSKAHEKNRLVIQDDRIEVTHVSLYFYNHCAILSWIKLSMNLLSKIKCASLNLCGSGANYTS